MSEAEKQAVYASSWAMALPSLKEGWGLVIGEAGMHGTPTVAYRAAGGTRESIEEGLSGLLADDYEEFVDGPRDGAHRAAGPGVTVGGRPRHEPPLHLGPRPGVLRAGGHASRCGAGRCTARTPKSETLRGPDDAVVKGQLLP